ncbi:MAG: hypothetical protein CVU22_27020 [Betaproteobacteria bacterium HGW-Betaproteobacteria-16]|nr:MAG: hypothetical protein CVU22_27020 [Betaproteobacteria bacterium HGW-Betaproteobacteria-16]
MIVARAVVQGIFPIRFRPVRDDISKLIPFVIMVRHVVRGISNKPFRGQIPADGEPGYLGIRESYRPINQADPEVAVLKIPQRQGAAIGQGQGPLAVVGNGEFPGAIRQRLYPHLAGALLHIRTAHHHILPLIIDDLDDAVDLAVRLPLIDDLIIAVAGMPDIGVVACAALQDIVAETAHQHVIACPAG